MKILYAVQGTGNGHIARAEQLIPFLGEYGEIEFFLSGNNYSLQPSFTPRFQSKGISLNYSGNGKLDYYGTFIDLEFKRAYKEAKELPVEKYDLVINDFEFITSLACKMKKINSIHFGHQASFKSVLCPRPKNKNWMGEFILKKFVKCSHYLGLHFDCYDQHIFPPIIKQEIASIEPKDKGHITIYLPAYSKALIFPHLKKLRHLRFQLFIPECKEIHSIENVQFMPIKKDLFNESLINCHGIICGAGFETPSEAMFLRKKLLVIPIQNHYEQACNAAALALQGVDTLERVDFLFYLDIEQWISKPATYKILKNNNIKKTVSELMKLHGSYCQHEIWCDDTELTHEYEY